MKPICELEESHGVNLGVGYKNNHACATFVSFIAKEQKNCLLNSLSKIFFFYFFFFLFFFFFFFFLAFKKMPMLMMEMWSCSRIYE